QSTILVEARNTPQAITLNDLIDVVKSVVGPTIKINDDLLKAMKGAFDRTIDLYMYALRRLDHARPGASDAVNPGMIDLPQKKWGPIKVTNNDLVTLFSYDESTLSTHEEELEWRGERQGQDSVRVTPRGPGDRSKVLADNTLCPGC